MSSIALLHLAPCCATQGNYGINYKMHEVFGLYTIHFVACTCEVHEKQLSPFMQIQILYVCVCACNYIYVQANECEWQKATSEYPMHVSGAVPKCFKIAIKMTRSGMWNILHTYRQCTGYWIFLNIPQSIYIVDQQMYMCITNVAFGC